MCCFPGSKNCYALAGAPQRITSAHTVLGKWGKVEQSVDISAETQTNGMTKFYVSIKDSPDNQPGWYGNLELRNGEKLLAVSSVHSARGFKGRLVFEFSIAEEFLASSTFTFCETLGDWSYWFNLRDFASKNGGLAHPGLSQVTPEYFELEIQLLENATTNSTLRVTVGTEQPFHFATVIGEVTNSISGVLHSATNGVFPVKIRVRWVSNSVVFDGESERLLRLGKTDRVGHVGAGPMILSEGFTLNSSLVLPTEHVVEPGETIALIARKYYGEEQLHEGYRAILAANPQIKQPHPLVSHLQIIIPKFP